MASDRLSLTGLGELISSLGKPINLQPALKSVRLILIGETKENFNQEHTPDKQPWAKLKKPRARKRDKRPSRRKGSKDKILSDTVALRSSVTAGAAGNIDVMTDSSLEWGTETDYAAYHQYGTMDYKDGGWVGTHDPGKKGIPPRPFLGINAEMEEKISEAVSGQVEREILRRI